MAIFKHNDFCLNSFRDSKLVVCGQDKIASASIQTYDIMVACSNSEEFFPNSFQRCKGFMIWFKWFILFIWFISFISLIPLIPLILDNWVLTILVFGSFGSNSSYGSFRSFGYRHFR